MPEAVRRSARERCRPALAGLAVFATVGLTVSLPSAALAAPAVKPTPAAAPVDSTANGNGNGQTKSPQSGTTTSPTTTSAPAAPAASAPVAPAPTATDPTASTKPGGGNADNGAGAAPGTTNNGNGGDNGSKSSGTTGSTAAGPAKAAPQQQAAPQAAPKAAGPQKAAPQAAGPQVAGPQISGPKVAAPKVAGPRAAPANRTLIGPVAIPVARTAPLAAPVRANPFTAAPATPFGPQVQRRSIAAAAVQGPRIPSRKAKTKASAVRKPVRTAAAAPAAVAPGIIPDVEVLPALTTVVRRTAEQPAAPLLMALVVGLFLLVQHRIDRRDPKLARVQLDQEPLTFRRLSYS